jgi:MFS family permease
MNTNCKENDGSADGAQESTSIPRTIWVLGAISLLSNSAGVIITTLSPEFIINVLGGNSTILGLIRGISESISYLVKLFSGVISDWLGKRKSIILAGYLCAAFTKPIFATCSGIKSYVIAQFIERISNGFRDTPRDALIADWAPKKLKGASYGIRQSCAFLGSMIGAIGCYFILSSCQFSNSGDSIRFVYWIAIIPIALAVLLIWFGIEEPKDLVSLKHRKGFPIRKSDMKLLGRKFWYYSAVCFIFMCARYSESFLVLRAQEVKIPLNQVSLVLAVMHLFNAPISKIVGSWSDKMDRKIFLEFGFCMMVVSCIILAFATKAWHIYVGVSVYGIHFGATQGTFYAMVADYSPPQIKATSIGIFNLVCCIGMLISNTITGKFWDIIGAQNVMLINAAVAFMAAICLIFVKQSTTYTSSIGSINDTEAY